MPSVQYYENLSDDELIDAAKYGVLSKELMDAMTYRLDEALRVAANVDFQEWEYKQKIEDLADDLALSRQAQDDLTETIRELRDEIDKLKGVNQ